MNRPHDFEDRLLAAEQTTPAFRQRYEKEVQSMLEKTLTPAQRFGFGVTTFVCVGWALFCGYMAITKSGWPELVRASFGFGALVSLIAALIVGKVFVQGKMNRKVQPNAINGLVWVVVTLVVTLFMVFTGRQPDAVKSVYVVVTGLVFLVFAAVSLITNRIDQAQIKTEEQFLELKLRLAELAERVDR